MVNKFSKEMHHFTEKIGDPLTADALKIIKHRYQIAESLSKEKLALEVGVGQGFGLQTIAKSATNYTGIEYSIENVNYLNQTQSDYVIIHGDAHSTPFSNSEFQIVNALAMIYYLDFEIFLQEVRRILSIDGTFFFCSSNKDAPGFNPSPFTTKYYSIPELKSLLDKNGFESEFFGSFAKYNDNENEHFANFKVFIKNFLKKIINFLPFGSKFWSYMRVKYFGGLIRLPKNINLIEIDNNWNNNFYSLKNDICNTQFRIIYCIAKLKKKN